MGVRSSGSHPTTTKADGLLLEYFRNTFSVGGGGSSANPPAGLVATGGLINDYTVSGTTYRAHVFTNSSTFDVSALSTDSSLGDDIEYLVVAGGGGAGEGGGGAGGLRTNLTGSPIDGGPYSVAVGSYTVTVGAGGRGGRQNSSNYPGNSNGEQGGNSEFFPTPASYPSASFIRSVGGGGGGGYQNDLGTTGGSGGGGCSGPGPSAVPGLAVSTDPISRSARICWSKWWLWLWWRWRWCWRSWWNRFKQIWW